MLTHPDILRIAYAANILILVPVCFAMLRETGVNAVFQRSVADSHGLRLLVFSLWFAILLSSAAGLFAPAIFAPVILIQIVYKSSWLLLFVLPAMRRAERVPTGIALTFAAIVLTYPLLAR